MYTIDFSVAKRIVKLDSDGQPGFVNTNAPQAMNMVNTWFNICIDVGVSSETISMIQNSLESCGLAAVVGACDDLTQIIQEGFLQEHDPLCPEGVPMRAYFAYDRSLLYPLACGIDDIISFAGFAHYPDVDVMDNPGMEGRIVRRALQFLQFPQRFTYIGSAGEKAAMLKFMRVNSKIDADLKNGNIPGSAICSMLRHELDAIYVRKHFTIDLEDATFSSGSLRLPDGVVDGKTSSRLLMDKYRGLASLCPSYLGDIRYPLPGGRWGKPQVSIPALMAVPKTLSSRRIIAPETVLINYYGEAVLEGLRRMLSKTAGRFINETDQSVNRELAAKGSCDGTWCTIDMSSASDSISRYTFFRCAPQWILPVYERFMSNSFEVIIDGKSSRHTLHMLLTSGNPLTWITEACWFLALGRLACKLAGVRDYRKKVYAYGDDLILPTSAFETACDLLECFGHLVNRKKSYGSGVFRESCGGWFYRGYDVTPVYWPRKTVAKTDLVSTLVDLQKKAVNAFFYNAVEYLTQSARTLEPKMTASPVGWECSDLWDMELNPGLFDRVTKHWAPPEPQYGYDRSPLCQHIAYYQYLRFGPMYNSALDELLGTSSSRYRALARFPK